MGRIRPSFLPRLIFAALDSNKSGAHGVVCSPSHLTAFSQIVYQLSTNKISSRVIILKPASFVRSTFLSPPGGVNNLVGSPGTGHGRRVGVMPGTVFLVRCYFSISFFHCREKCVTPAKKGSLLPWSLTQHFVCPHSLLNLLFSGFTHTISGRAGGWAGKRICVGFILLICRCCIFDGQGLR